MKKLFCLFLALTMCLTTITAFAVTVPTTSTNLPAMPSAPDAPEIIRVQKDGTAITITLDQVLPAESLVTVLGLDEEYMLVVVNAAPGADNTYTAQCQTAVKEWTGVEIAWVDDAANALACYDAAGGLESVTCYDAKFNEYVFDSKGVFYEFGNASSGVRAQFNDRGAMVRYGYEAFRSTTVWFSPDGEIVYAEYNDGDGGIAAKWEPNYGWFVLTSQGRVKVKVGVSPWDAEPLLEPEEKDEEEEKPEITWFPRNTITVAGLKLQEADPSLPDKWYNVLPVDLTRQGRQTYFLIIGHTFYIGKCYVDVWGDEVTVSCTLLDHPAVEPLSSYGRWFTELSQITADSIESAENGFVFGEPVSISEDLGSADTALLFIRSKATFYQPFRDGTTLNRYWRNLPEWKEFREGLQELMPLVEK